VAGKGVGGGSGVQLDRMQQAEPASCCTLISAGSYPEEPLNSAQGGAQVHQSPQGRALDPAGCCPCQGGVWSVLVVWLEGLFAGFLCADVGGGGGGVHHMRREQAEDAPVSPFQRCTGEEQGSKQKHPKRKLPILLESKRALSQKPSPMQSHQKQVTFFTLHGEGQGSKQKHLM